MASRRDAAYLMPTNQQLAKSWMGDNGTRPTATLRSRVGRLAFVQAIWAWKAHILELALVFVCYLVYLGSRGLVYSDLDEKGLANADRVMSAEKWVGFFWEPGWQSWVLDHIDGLALFFNWAYIITYWPIVAVLGVTLYISNRPQYYYYRSVLVINLVMALLIFMLFPVTSPFNLTNHFVNTIQTLGPSFYGSSDMASYYNINAAMPSLHFSWAIVLGVVLVRTSKGCFKPLGLLYPGLTFFAITITGNHFILDAIAGGLLAGVAFAVMELGFRRSWIGKERTWETLRGLLRSGRAYSPINNWPNNWVRKSAAVRRSILPHHKSAIQ